MLNSRVRTAGIIGAVCLAGCASLPASGAATGAQAGIRLSVNASHVAEKMIATRESIPARPGPLTLYYPKWIPGEHKPDGPVGNVTGLVFTAHGKRIPWTRDLKDVYTFHLRVPAGVRRIEARFTYLELAGSGYERGVSATAKLMELNWNQNLLYLAGVRAQQQIFTASLQLPVGWQFGTALPVASRQGQRIQFQPAALNRLVDSPVLAGEYFRAINITPPGEPIEHEIDIAADRPTAIVVSPALRMDLKSLVTQTGRVFGSRHYRDYHFLFSLSNYVPYSGLEHHESDDSRVPLETLAGPNATYVTGSILSHEFVHSWNGKFRRPASLSAPYYEAPEETNMLWVYEGLTDYLGHVLAVRSGFWTRRQYRAYLAATAAMLGPGRPGRTWRPLQDTANAVPGMFGPGWVNWRRGEDYYPEGDLLWLEVASIIARASHGRKSFDDFCREFYGGTNRGPQLKPFTFEQLTTALNRVARYSWARFFRRRLNSLSPAAPLAGIEASGWKLIFNARPGRRARRLLKVGVNAQYSIGLTAARNGQIMDAIWGGPAFRAGLVPGMLILRVNGQPYTPQRLEAAIAGSSGSPVQLTASNQGNIETVTLDWRGGARYPHLVREKNAADTLDREILRPR